MSYRKVLIKISLFLLGLFLTITPFLSVYIYGSSQPNAYTKTYYAALVDKYNRLESIKNKKKIVVIGASGTAFGLDSKTIQKYFPDYDVQNFGLYADLGIKLMLDLSKENISKDDIVVISPELSPQGMSLYFNPVSFLKATEERTDLFDSLTIENKTQVIGGYIDFLKQKKKIDPNEELFGVYQRKNLNIYGDISYYGEVDGDTVSLRTSNIMPLNYDLNTPVNITTDLLNNEFIDYINDFAKNLEKIGATVLFDYAPINALSITSSQNEADDFSKKISNRLAFPLIGNMGEHVIPFEYFYDSNFHTNDAGAIYNSLLLVRDIKTFLGDPSNVEEYPDKPKKGDDLYNETEEDIKNSKYFTFEEYDDGYILNGLTNDGVSQKQLRIPGFYNGKRVIRLKPFTSINQAENVIIPKIQTFIDDSFFSSFKNIKTIHILEKNPNNISIGFDLFKNTNEVKIYVPKTSYPSFANDYYWAVYSNLMEGE